VAGGKTETVGMRTQLTNSKRLGIGDEGPQYPSAGWMSPETLHLVGLKSDGDELG
jgi:hypothetical protein